MVLGVPRSGTSCVAGVLWRLGVDMGSGHLPQADRSNVLGYYEDMRWQTLNKMVTGLKYGTKRPTQIDGAQKARYHHLAKKCEAAADKHGQVWGFKDPRSCITAQFIWPHLEDARMVVTIRNAKHSALSIQKHSQVSYGGKLRMTFEEAGDYIHKFGMALQQTISLFDGPVLMVNYEKLLNRTNKEVARLEEFCYDGLDIKPSYAEFNQALNWVDRRMDHCG